MSDVVVQVEGLGKEYRLGGKPAYSTLGEQLRNWTPLRALMRRERRAEATPPFWALKDVSFEVKRGEVVGIIGRNGAGKSTLLKILSRITEPTEGRADIRGRVGSLLEVGTGFHPELTGRENVYLNGAILGMRRTEVRQKFDDIVAFAEVEKFIDTPVKHYSSGMYTRLAFAVAAHLEPEILVVDEVLAVGDVQFQKKCLGKMSSVASEGRTVLFVSHNLSLLISLCSTGLFLNRGRLIPTDSLSECVRLYNDVAVVRGQDWVGEVGGDSVKLTRATIRADASGGTVARGELLVVEAEYDVRAAAVPELVFGIEVYDHKNQLLCHSFLTETLEGNVLSRAKLKGRHRASVGIDTSLFAEGHYFVKFDLGLHGRRRLVTEEILLSFTVAVDRFNGFSQGSFKPNSLVPRWEWEWETLSKTDPGASDVVRSRV